MRTDSASDATPQPVAGSAPEAELSPEAMEYRKRLGELESQAQDSYDKAVITLSGGALGLSLIFVKDVAGPTGLPHLHLALTAWLLWTISLGCVLWSFYSSRAALRWTIRKFDQGADLSKGAGGFAEKMTQVFNIASGATFIGGAVAFVLFGFFAAGKLP